MKLEPQAKNYAGALFNVAAQSGSEKAVKDSLELVNSSLRTSPEFRAFLLSKRISQTQKAEVVKTALGDQCHSIVSEFLGLISDDNLVKLLAAIGKAYHVKFAEEMNIVSVVAHVTSKLSDNEEAKLKASLESALGKSTDLNVNVDPALIGGIKLRVGNKFLDASIQNQLENMRLALLEA
ncbi:ATP synthase F1 subunit delta [Caldithrix abyssi]|nr:ATP synthase F1 subunit delta [Caldithrix abyssi]